MFVQCDSCFNAAAAMHFLCIITPFESIDFKCNKVLLYEKSELTFEQRRADVQSDR